MIFKDTPATWAGRLQLFELARELEALSYRWEPVSSDEVRQLRLRLEELEKTLATEERRARQALEMDQRSDASLMPVSGSGNIGTFVEDLISHAKRLDCSVTGLFNDIALVALPSSISNDLIRWYIAGRDALTRNISRSKK